MKRSKLPALPLLLAIGIFGFGGLAWYVSNSPNSDLPQELTTKKSAMPKGETKVFTPKVDGAEVRLLEEKKEVPENQDPKVFSVNEFLRISGIVPEGAKLLGVDMGDDGLATLSFTQPFRKTYGTTDEETLLDGIRASLGQFPEVKRILLTIEGEPLETLGGVDLTVPIDVLPEKDAA